MSKLIYYRQVDGVKSVRVYLLESGLYGILAYVVNEPEPPRKSIKHNLRKNPCPRITAELAKLGEKHGKPVYDRLEKEAS